VSDGRLSKTLQGGGHEVNQHRKKAKNTGHEPCVDGPFDLSWAGRRWRFRLCKSDWPVADASGSV